MHSTQSCDSTADQNEAEKCNVASPDTHVALEVMEKREPYPNDSSFGLFGGKEIQSSQCFFHDCMKVDSVIALQLIEDIVSTDCLFHKLSLLTEVMMSI